MRWLVSFVFLVGICNVFAETVKEKLDRLENELLDIKLGRADSTSLKVSGDFRTVFFAKDFENVDGRDSNKNETVSEFRLNLDSDGHDRVKFYSTLAATYFWNNNFQSPSVKVLDNTQKVQGMDMRVQKAYIDYFLNDKKLSISLGRLPTQYGPPTHFSANTGRQGTYPLLLYSVPLDGIALTANLGKFMGAENRYIFRLIFSPLNNTSSVSSIETVGNEAPFNTIESEGGSVFMANLETSGDLSSGGNYAFILQGYSARFGRSKGLSGVRGALQSSMPAGSIDRNVYEIASDDENIATINALIGYFELTNFGATKFDLYGSYKQTEFKREGNFTAVIVEDNNGAALGGVGSEIDIGGFLYDQDESGESINLGLRYKFNPKFNLGLEYLRQTKGDAPFGINTFNFSDLPINLGVGYRFYSNYKIEHNLNFGVGLEVAETEYSFNGQKYTDVDSRTETIFTSLRYSF